MTRTGGASRSRKAAPARYLRGCSRTATHIDSMMEYSRAADRLLLGFRKIASVTDSAVHLDPVRLRRLLARTSELFELRRGANASQPRGEAFFKLIKLRTEAARLI